jgi:hypothetical protein
MFFYLFVIRFQSFNTICLNIRNAKQMILVIIGKKHHLET